MSAVCGEALVSDASPTIKLNAITIEARRGDAWLSAAIVSLVIR